MEEAIKIGAAVLIPNLGSIVNGRITRNNIKPWYEQLKKPSFNPPSYVFPPVWISIYSAMGYASYLVYRESGGFNEKSSVALALYGGQLALNWACTPLFFKYHYLKWVRFN